jgi:DNA-binding response OmpR family regulator
MSVPATKLLVREPAGQSPKFRRVLLVEDDDTLRRVIARNLTSRGIAVREAATAAEAIEAATTEPPDLLLLDINLPDQTGWDVLRELKRHGGDVPTIVLSAVRVGQSRLDEFHPLAYLPKPFPLEALLRLVLAPKRPDVPADDDVYDTC